MKLKKQICKNIISILAGLGFIILMGAVGTSDYMTEAGIYYPFMNTVRLMVVGILLMVPAIIREVN